MSGAFVASSYRLHVDEYRTTPTRIVLGQGLVLQKAPRNNWWILEKATGGIIGSVLSGDGRIDPIPEDAPINPQEDRRNLDLAPGSWRVEFSTNRYYVRMHRSIRNRVLNIDFIRTKDGEIVGRLVDHSDEGSARRNISPLKYNQAGGDCSMIPLALVAGVVLAGAGYFLFKK